MSKNVIYAGFIRIAFFRKKILQLLLFISMMSSVCVAFADNNSEVVLVTHVSSSLESLSFLQIRRLYLGFRIDNKQVNRPVINRSSDNIYAEFLKNVMHMTEDGYKRKIIRKVFRHGSNYVKEIRSVEDISKHLEVHNNDIAFVKKKDLALIKNARVVMRLW